MKRMEIKIMLNKSVEENAAEFFEKAKKLKKKLEGIKKAVIELEEKIKKAEKEIPKIEMPKKVRKKKWYEKFHWFFTSDGFLVLAGKDAHSNEILIKKYMQKEDLFLHADIVGAAHCIIKNGINASKKALKEAVAFAAAFSKAWKNMLSSVDVYYVKPEQVSKKAPSKEYLQKGAFMVYGKREWFRKVELKLAIGLKKEDEYYVVVCGPESAIKKQAEFYVVIRPGKLEKGKLAKKIKEIFDKRIPENNVRIEEILGILPSNGEILNIGTF